MENLRALNITAASLHGRLGLADCVEDQLVSVLGKYEPRWPRRSVDKTGLYEVAGTQHHTGLEIELLRRPDPGVIVLTVGAHPFSATERFRAPTRERQTREFIEIQAILDELANMSLVTGLTARVGWLFPPGTRRPIIALPLMSVDSSAVPVLGNLGGPFN